jgi:hypothetical protein
LTSVVAEAELLPPPNRPLPVRDANRGTPETTFPKRSLAVTMIELPEATAVMLRTSVSLLVPVGPPWRNATVPVADFAPAVAVNVLTPAVHP